MICPRREVGVVAGVDMRWPCPVRGSTGAGAGRDRGGAGSGGRGGARVHRLTVQPAGTVGRADQRTGERSGEADLVGLGLELDELLRLDPPLDGVVPGGGADVLGDGDQLAAGLVEVAQRLADLLA